MTMIRWQQPTMTPWLSPWNNLNEEMQRLFKTAFSDVERAPQLMGAWGPVLDVHEDKDNLIVRVELPGMKKEEIEILVHDNTLTVSGERKRDNSLEESDAHRLERFYGRFQRSVSLPVSVDHGKVKASYVDGILTVTLPKAEEAKPRQIEISDVR